MSKKRLILQDNTGKPYLHCLVVNLTHNGVTFLGAQKEIHELDGTTTDKIMNLTLDECLELFNWLANDLGVLDVGVLKEVT